MIPFATALGAGAAGRAQAFDEKLYPDWPGQWVKRFVGAFRSQSLVRPAPFRRHR
jgi:hypothetical protein